MPNATIRVQCPTCTETLHVRAIVDPGEKPDYFLGGGSGPEIVEFEEALEPECLCLEASLEEGNEEAVQWYKDKVFAEAEVGEIELDEYDPY
jgi:hypothetical protein